MPVTAESILETPVFEVYRFDHVDDRLELAGRWSGGRGMRFMRPTLTLSAAGARGGRWSGVRGRRFMRRTRTLPAAGRRVRLLASLEHKPWSPDDEGEWLASFPWDGGPVDVDGAELSVSRTLVVDLPAPGESAEVVAPEPAPPAKAPKRSGRFVPKQDRDASEGLREQLAAAVAERDA